MLNIFTKLGKAGIFIFPLLIIAFVVLYWAESNNLHAANLNAKQEVFFEIKKGDSIDDIGKNLHQQGFIKSPSSFPFFAKKIELSTITPGKYKIAKSFTPKKIASRLKEGGTQSNPILVEAGDSTKMIIAKIVAANLLNEENEYFYEDVKGVYAEPEDIGIYGRGTCDIIIKDDTVMLRAGKNKPFNSQQVPRRNEEMNHVLVH